MTPFDLRLGSLLFILACIARANPRGYRGYGTLTLSQICLNVYKHVIEYLTRIYLCNISIISLTTRFKQFILKNKIVS